MNCVFRKLAPAISVCLVFGGAFAQESGESARGPIPGVEAAVEGEPQPAGTLAEPGAAPSEAASGEKMPWEADGASNDAVVPSPVADEAPAVDRGEKLAKQPKPPKEPKAPRESRSFEIDGLRVGLRGALGIGGFRLHTPLTDRRFEATGGDAYLTPWPHISAAIGVAAAYPITELIDVALEGQYSFYKARSGFSLSAQNYNGPNLVPVKETYFAGTRLHTIEFPLLARLHLEPLTDLPLYAEGGFSLGANVYSELYESGGVYERPVGNYVAGGIVLGAGYEITENLRAGLRANYVFTRYAKSVQGNPFSVRADATYYFLNY